MSTALKLLALFSRYSRNCGLVTVFPGEIYQAPCSWCERAYHKLVYYHQVDIGGHFAAWEQPDLFAT